MAEKMKAIVLEGFGGIDKLKLGEFTKPFPGPDEVQIKIVYTAVNPVDWKIRTGMLKDRIPHEFPLILGWDAAGTVSAVGKNVKKFQVDNEVFAYCRQPTIKWGTYAEYICIDANNIAFKPKNLSFAQAAAIPLAGLTAWQSLFDTAHLKRGETILIHAGAGGVGSLAIQFARQIGAKILSTASEANHRYVHSLGAETVIDYKKESFVDKVKNLYPEGIDVVFDTVGGQTLKDSYQVIKPGGRLVSIVELPDQELANQEKIQANYVFVSPNGEELQKISDLFSKGQVKAIQVEEMPLARAGEAQEINQQRHVAGKIVLKI